MGSQALALREGAAGLLRGSHNSVVRALAEVRGLGFDPQWLPRHFFSQFVSMLIYHITKNV